MVRKIGQKKESLADETPAKRLKTVKQFVRTDFGGKNPVQTVKNKMHERGVECGDKSAEAIVSLLQEAMAGVRKRTFDRIDSVIAFLEGKSPIEKLP